MVELVLERALQTVLQRAHNRAIPNGATTRGNCLGGVMVKRGLRGGNARLAMGVGDERNLGGD